MTLAIWDHVIVLVLLVAAPLEGWYSYRKLALVPAQHRSAARMDWYRSVIVLEWGMVALVLALWLIEGRALSVLGFALPLGRSLLIGLGFTIAIAVLLFLQGRSALSAQGPALERLKAQLAAASEILPRSETEHRRFRVVAWTAGICEEVLYRGYLIAYLAVFIDPRAGALVAALLFGIGHAYQGVAGVIRTGLVGVGMGLLFVYSGSLLWPIVLHVLIDLQGGMIGRRVLGDDPTIAEGGKA